MSIETPEALWRALGLIEEVADAEVERREPDIDDDLLLGEFDQREQLKTTIAMVAVATLQVGKLLDPSRHRAGWCKLRGENAAPEEAKGVFTTETGAKLWAVRQSLVLAQVLISTAAHPRGTARALIDARARYFEDAHLSVIRLAGELVFNACGAVLEELQEASE